MLRLLSVRKFALWNAILDHGNTKSKCSKLPTPNLLIKVLILSLPMQVLVEVLEILWWSSKVMLTAVVRVYSFTDQFPRSIHNSHQAKYAYCWYQSGRCHVYSEIGDSLFSKVSLGWWQRSMFHFWGQYYGVHWQFGMWFPHKTRNSTNEIESRVAGSIQQQSMVWEV